MPYLRGYAHRGRSRGNVPENFKAGGADARAVQGILEIVWKTVRRDAPLLELLRAALNCGPGIPVKPGYWARNSNALRGRKS